jgi:hypothetical protein
MAEMGTARRLERRIEHMVDGLAGFVFGGALHPSEFGIHLLREADLAVTEGAAGATIPNAFILTVNSGQEVPDALARGLESLLEETAAERGWRLEGPARVTIEHSKDLARTEITCTATREPGARSPWGHLVRTSGPPVPLTDNRVLIGRSSDCDIVINDAEISRVHAILWRAGGRVWLDDLSSSNGTSIDGVTVAKATPLDEGAVISFGPVTFDYVAK